MEFTAYLSECRPLVLSKFLSQKCANEVILFGQDKHVFDNLESIIHDNRTWRYATIIHSIFGLSIFISRSISFKASPRLLGTFFRPCKDSVIITISSRIANVRCIGQLCWRSPFPLKHLEYVLQRFGKQFRRKSWHSWIILVFWSCILAVITEATFNISILQWPMNNIMSMSHLCMDFRTAQVSMVSKAFL